MGLPRALIYARHVAVDPEMATCTVSYQGNVGNTSAPSLKTSGACQGPSYWQILLSSETLDVLTRVSRAILENVMQSERRKSAVNNIPSLSKISETRNDVCLFVQSLVDPTSDLPRTSVAYPETGIIANVNEPQGQVHGCSVRIFRPL